MGFQVVALIVIGIVNFINSTDDARKLLWCVVIINNYISNSIFIHFNGAFHSNNYEGILWYLKKLRPNLIYSTISTVSQKNVTKLNEENKGLADFIICVDDNMTTTH